MAGKKDFFISYTGADEQIASWIAYVLEEAHFGVIFQPWDFNTAGRSIIGNINTATIQSERTIAVISPDYFNSRYTVSEWETAVKKDPEGEVGLLIPIIVREHEIDGILSRLNYISFVGLNEDEAQSALLKGIKRERAKPKEKPSYEKEPLTNRPKPRFPGTLPDVCNLSHPNPNFTGRDIILQELRKSLKRGGSTAVTQQALYGLGGIGKTQLALEYAHRHAASYDLIWWLRADTTSTLFADFSSLAMALDLLKEDETGEEIVLKAVLKWLNKNTGWLLVFDNAEDAGSIRKYLPQAHGGHVLITSRNQNWKPICASLELKVWSREESVDFLLKRTGQKDEKGADEIAEALGDLPLALEQAAAYIDTRKKTFADYLALFNSRRRELWQREKCPNDYPDTVATTWELAFGEIQNVPLAKEMLSLCALLAPNAIPTDLLQNALAYLKGDEGKPEAVDEFDFDDAVGKICAYSLFSVESEQMNMHRLVQAVIRDQITEAERRRYENALINALSDLFPDEGYNNPTCWPDCARLLPHAESITANISNDNEAWHETAILLNSMGLYHFGRAAYAEAEPLLRRALEIREKQLGEEHPLVATSLNNLGLLLQAQGKNAEAEPLYRRSLEIHEKQLGEEHPHVAMSLNNLAGLLQAQGKYAEAEPLYRRALEIWEKQLGEEHPLVATSLNNLGLLLQAQGKYAEAEPLIRRALEIREKQLGEEHPDVAMSLNNLGALLDDQGKYAEAEPLYRRALEIREKQLGEEHPDVATSLNNLAELLRIQGKYGEAEPLYRRAVEILEKTLGNEHPDTITVQNNLSILLKQMK
ncbi:TPR repeat-containing protein [Chloroherpeton thalassium ATCC 35110]|uniref:TPR repeat-containing protein n=1 Tax=Chloroherpeton thalassium (strain ATCC 35110 / GB-78) TaxID=517418 RepID=B3QZ81_CHLT3|nr:FxSxx-COOH system tetratricopeptide repeat protein [Chloroherpeton thalassium]ACF13774.1 TPR repeat-containing protein [Chloroherpeton thalassium ATCC 35110]